MRTLEKSKMALIVAYSENENELISVPEISLSLSFFFVVLVASDRNEVAESSLFPDSCCRLLALW